METVKRQIAYNYSNRTQPILYIVVHDTGNHASGSNASAHYNYFNSDNRDSSADVFVDDHSAWFVNDYTKYYSWHCGDGKGAYGIANSNSIGVEMCVNSDGDYQNAMRNTVEVVRGLMKELNIPLERVVRHYDASRKKCPASMSNNNWEQWSVFLRMLKEGEGLTVSQYEELKKEIEVLKNPMIYNYIDENMPEWARPTIQKLVDKGYLQGGDDGLNLTDELLRVLVINDRAGIYD